MTAPYVPQDYFTPDFGGVHERLRRMIQDQLRVTPAAETFTPRAIQAGRLAQLVQQHAPDAVAQLIPAEARDGRYTLAEMGDATVDHGPSLLQRIRQGLGSTPVRGAVAGLASVLDPTAGGTEGFLGSAARAFTATGQYRDQAAQAAAAAQQEALDKDLQRRNIESQIAERSRTTGAFSEGPILANGNASVIDRNTGRTIDTGQQAYIKPVGEGAQPRYQFLPSGSNYVAVNPLNPTEQVPTAIATTPAEGERRAAGLLYGAERALSDVQDAIQRGFSTKTEPALSQAVGTLFNNTTWRNALASDVGQQYYTAVERLFTNYLYTVSGAQVPPQEIAAQARQKTESFFDARGTRQQKLRALQQAVEEMRVIAGRAAPGVSSPGGSPAPTLTLDPVP